MAHLLRRPLCALVVMVVACAERHDDEQVSTASSPLVSGTFDTADHFDSVGQPWFGTVQRTRRAPRLSLRRPSHSHRRIASAARRPI